MFLVVVLVALAAAALPIVAIAIAVSVRGKLQWAESEIDRLQQEMRELKRTVARSAPAPPPAASMAAAPPAPHVPVAPAPAVSAPQSLFGDDLPAPEPSLTPGPIPVAPSVTPARAPAAVPALPRAPHAPALSAESIIGGLWLQNVGSVLVLLGVFFLILWGYNTGHIGPGGLVAAAVVAGAILVWRGDRMARRIAPLGHALVGVGLGVAYLALYLGHFLLGVLSPPVMYSSLAVVSLLAFRLGRHYRVQVIEALAVLGAFVPYVAPVLVGGEQPHVQPAALLAYLAGVNLLVFARAREGGFSGLTLESVALTTLTWLTVAATQAWGWGTTAGLAALYLGFGHAPLPRLARDPKPVDPIEGMVIVLSPFLFLLAASPFLGKLSRPELGLFLFAMAAIESAAATWIGRTRGQRDVWYGLVGAAVLYLAAATERLLGATLTPLAWTVEGVALVSVGLAAGSGWLRGLGAVLAFLGVLVSTVRVTPGLMQAPGAIGHALPPLLTPSFVRGLVEMAALFVGERIYRRHRDALDPDEASAMPIAFGGVAQAVLFACIGRLALRAAGAFVAQEGFAGQLTWATSQVAAPTRAGFIGVAITAAGWAVQAAWLLVSGLRRKDGVVRTYGYVALTGAALAFAMTVTEGAVAAVWIPGDLPIIHPAGPFQILFLLLSFTLCAHLDRERARLLDGETRASDVLTVLTNVLLLFWWAQEAGRLALLLPADPHVHLAAVATSVAWIVQAVVLVAIGWRKSESLLRWTGLTFLGVTLFKVLFLDLAEVGVFWRFVIAIGFGVVLMAVSYAYQRSQRAGAAALAADDPRS